MLTVTYRSIATAIVDAEMSFRFLDGLVGTKDKPDASDLIVANGSIEFGSLTPSAPNHDTQLTLPMPSCRQRQLLVRRSRYCFA